MKADLDATIENLSNDLQSSAGSNVFTESPVQKPEVPTPTQAEMECFYSDLSKSKTKPVVLSLIPLNAYSYMLLSRKIPSVMDLFDKNNLELPYN